MIEKEKCRPAGALFPAQFACYQNFSPMGLEKQSQRRHFGSNILQIMLQSPFGVTFPLLKIRGVQIK
jgi:hypothetical protein